MDVSAETSRLDDEFRDLGMISTSFLAEKIFPTVSFFCPGRLTQTDGPVAVSIRSCRVYTLFQKVHAFVSDSDFWTPNAGEPRMGRPMPAVLDVGVARHGGTPE